jgi:iron complex transport system substrate-binding protein
MKRKQRVSILILLSVLSIIVCRVTGSSTEDLFPHKASLQYATGFTIEYHDTYKIMTVLTPWKDADTTFQYVLVQRGTEAPAGYEDAQHIEIPVRSIVTMSTSYLPYLVQLGILDALVAHDNFKHINTPEVRDLINAGKLKETGEGPDVNIELLMVLNPDLIMTHGSNSMYDTHPKFLEIGLPVALNASYMERHPLGRTEWMKFIAAFFNKEQEAEVVFQKIADAYETMAATTRNVAVKPTVFVNAPYQGNWWVPGGQSYLAVFLKDAGAAYVWADTTASTSTPVDFEVVYERAIGADFWLNPGGWESLKDGLAVDERFAQFKAFQEGNVYNNNARVNEHGGNDYWESGLANPDVVLADLIKIFHSELVPEHELVYYQKLR